MGSLQSVLPRYNRGKVKISTIGGDSFSLLSLVIHQVHCNSTWALSLTGRDHAARDTEAIECKVDILARRASVSYTVHGQLNLVRLEAPAGRRPDLEHVFPFLVQREEVIAIGGSALCLFLEATFFRKPVISLLWMKLVAYVERQVMRFLSSF